uniref:Pre-rRNA-processing protein TSR2 n=1 Tax=Trypanosoma congolense (strain IL3000) TaxID=1068625 RepID=G0UZE7_TRYCI|nr:conserved hypothetical protein [Trypanosoma congolense IL3000]
MQQQGPSGFQVVRPPFRATPEQFERFIVGLDAVLNQWTALHLVARHCDLSALTLMRRELVKWFQTDGEVYSDDLELFFENFFAEARAVIIEDDSMKEVGDVLHDMYCRCCQDDFSTVERYVSSLEVYRNVNPVQLSVNMCGADDEDGVEGEEEGCKDDACGERDGEAQVWNEEAEGSCAKESVGKTKKNRNRKKKNAYDRDADGWCVVRS